MKDIRNNLEVNILSQLEKLEKAKAGSEESKIIADEIVRLTEAYLKCVREEDEIFNNDASRQKIRAEMDKIRAEIAQMTEEPNFDLKTWVMQIKPDVVANILVILTITGAAIGMEKQGHIFPERIVKWGMKLFRIR